MNPKSVSETKPAPPFSSPLLDRVGGFVAGRWVQSSDETIPVFDPSNGNELARIPRLGASETTKAVLAAQTALRTMPAAPERAEWLTRIAALLTEHNEELARIITHENGKPLAEARGEVAYAAGFYRYAAKSVASLESQVLDARPKDHRWTVHHRAAGVVGLITPWNFPLAMLAKKLAAALAAGCTSVVKPAEITPLTCIAFFRLLEKLGLPPGTINLVMGDAPAIGRVLCEHPSVRVLSFTGSTAVGRLLATQAAPYLKRVSLELGGNAPFIVCEDADLDAAVAHLRANKFRAAGQTCVCANRILVHEDVADDFTKRAAAEISKLVVGPGMRQGVDLGPLINEGGWNKVATHLEDALHRGARIVGGQGPGARPAAAEGWFFAPVVLRDVPPDALCMNEETFGPLVPIRTFKSDDEAIALANRVDAGLAAYVFCGDVLRGERFVERLAFGHVGLNTATGPTPEAPFGGMGDSGYGREGGLEGLLEYTEAQTVPTPEVI